MPTTQPDDFEFEWVGDRLVHKPTGYEWWWSYPGTASDEIRYRSGTLGDSLFGAGVYRFDDLTEIAQRLLYGRKKA
jgi:hypothetical protein